MFTCNVEYCDFCVCTFPKSNECSFVEQTFRDDEFWAACVEKAKHFFIVCLLPEVIGNWYTLPAVLSYSSSDTSQSNQNNSCDSEIERYCYYCGPEQARSQGGSVGSDEPPSQIKGPLFYAKRSTFYNKRSTFYNKGPLFQ